MGLHDGNLFFKHKYPSLDIERAIEHMDSFEQFEKYFDNDLMGENLLGGTYLYHLLERYGYTPSGIANYIGVSGGYMRKVASGREQNPRRDVLLAACVYMKATVEETQILLRYSGKEPLHARKKRDAIIWFALKKRQELYDLNLYLYEHGYTTLYKHTERED